MEGMLAGTVTLDQALPLRTALYRALNAIWREGEARTAEAVDHSPPDYRLQVLSPVQRAVLLLTSMEGFTTSEAAQVLDLDLTELHLHLDAAEEALERQLATDVLIIEDEPIIGLDLTRLTRELGHRVTGVAATRDEAVEMARRQRPGLVLSDIRLADGSSGLDAATDILKSFDIPVIFITAFPERLLTGERPEPAFLITKPFREETVKALIGQALFFHRPQPELSSAN
jgi:CheY-like chemotaxis protein